MQNSTISPATNREQAQAIGTVVEKMSGIKRAGKWVTMNGCVALAVHEQALGDVEFYFKNRNIELPGHGFMLLSEDPNTKITPELIEFARARGVNMAQQIGAQVSDIEDRDATGVWYQPETGILVYKMSNEKSSLKIVIVKEDHTFVLLSRDLDASGETLRTAVHELGLPMNF